MTVEAPEAAFGWRRNIEPVQQSEASECGLACVAMLARYNGIDTDMRGLRAKASATRGINLTTIVGLFDDLGLRTRAVRIELHELKQLRVPCIVHLRGDHFAVLERVSGSTVALVDPALGRVRVPHSRLSLEFTGVALEAWKPTKRASPFPPNAKKSSIGETLGFPGNFSAVLAILLGFSVLVEGTVLAIPALMQVVIDQVLNSASSTFLLGLVACFCMLMIFQMAATGCRLWATAVTNYFVGIEWSTATFEQLVKLPYSFFVGRGVGAIKTNFDSIEPVKSAVTTTSVSLVVDGLMAVLAVVILFHYNAKMSLVVLGGALLYLVVRFVSYDAIRSNSVDLITLKARETSLLLEGIRGAEVLRSNNAQFNQARRFSRVAVDWARKSARLEALTLLFSSASSTIAFVTKAIIIYYGATLSYGSQFSAGMLIAFIAYCDQFIGRLGRVVDASIEMRVLSVHLDRVGDITLTSIDPTSPTCRNLASFERMSIQACHFRYGAKTPWILRGTSFDLRRGEVVALAGRSGAGKSTLIRLLNRTLLPEAGQILVDGVPIEMFSAADVRKLIGVVGQGDILLSGTIRENIACLDEDIDDDRVVACSMLACIDSEIKALPMGFDTRITDGAAQLSGGQVQRICIARALYRHPALIALDEGTANIDEATEAQVISNIRSTGIAMVLVTHRASAMRLADRVISI